MKTEPPNPTKPDRKAVLLRAAFDLLQKQRYSGYALNLLSETAYYDLADCDGYCLLEDIANELGIHKETEPLKNPEETITHEN